MRFQRNTRYSISQFFRHKSDFWPLSICTFYGYYIYLYIWNIFQHIRLLLCGKFDIIDVIMGTYVFQQYFDHQDRYFTYSIFSVKAF